MNSQYQQVNDAGLSLFNIGILAGIALLGLLVIGLILARLFKRASKERAFVRTGFGGEKVIKDGGAIVLPVLHDTIEVNMNTLKLTVERTQASALITKDRLRVDVLADFYVRVRPDERAIATAAQTLGERTTAPHQLKELVEGKFVDALRSVAAGMTMDELHEQRAEFVQRVQQSVLEDLEKNGLELESVSLTGLDQTQMDYFDASNAFDAAGLTILTKQIEAKKRERNDIEQDTRVQIREKNLQAEQETLKLDRESEYANLEQQREIAVRRAEQEATIAKEQATRTQEAEQARIDSERAIEQKRIAKHREIESEEIRKHQALEIAEQEKSIAVAEKSQAESEAERRADEARAEAVKARESVVTAQEIAEAERKKQIALVAAREDAEKQSISITVAAEAEKAAADDRAEALRLEAQGIADQSRIQAEGEAAAIIAKAEADEKAFEVEATGQRALNEAANILRDEQIGLKFKLAMLSNIEGIISASAKPIEAIDSIKLVNVGGLPGVSNTHESTANGKPASGNMAQDAMNAALGYRSQAPLVDALLKEIGLNGGSFEGMATGAKTVESDPSDPTDEEETLTLTPTTPASQNDGFIPAASGPVETNVTASDMPAETID